MRDALSKDQANSQERNTAGSGLFSESKEAGAKADPFLLQAPQLTLPKGGGAIKGIDEKFRVNAANGTATLSIPLPFSSARGFSPSLSLEYNSGSGAGLFGLGWSASLSSIKRKTENGLPQYNDALDTDTFLLSGAEDLVPEFLRNEDDELVTDADGTYVHNEFDLIFKGIAYKVRRYRPRIEGLFSRIERWTDKATGIHHWRVVSSSNVTTVYGRTAAARISNPEEERQTFEWLPEFIYDDKGNCAVYEYIAETGTGMDASALHNKNRLNGNASFTNAYLKRIRYGNVAPFQTPADAVPDQFLFETVFDYGEHDAVNIPFNQIAVPSFRSDAFSNYKPGFEIRTCRLCQRVLLYHHFAELPGGSALVKALNFTHNNNGEDGFTFLTAATLTGYTKHDDGTYTQKSFPPFTFNYSKHQWNDAVQSVDPKSLAGTPGGADEETWQLTDLYNEGLPGLLSEQAFAWFYKSNLGEGRFAAPNLVKSKPSFTGLNGRIRLMDLEGNGEKQAVAWSEQPKGFFGLDDDDQWESFQAFEQMPFCDLSDRNTRLLDLNGDGRADIFITEQDAVCWYPSNGKKGFDAPRKTVQKSDEEKGPSVVFNDGEEAIFLADMSGDGLMDLVRIRNGEVCYWPQLGHGRFGAKVNMDNAPVFDKPNGFDTSFIKLADVDGSGTTDIIYHGQNDFCIWLNQQGNRFLAKPKRIATLPELDRSSQVSVTDLLGAGTACIVWNNPFPKQAASPLRYIDLMGGIKPHLLSAYKNNLGKEVFFDYTPSTQFYLADKAAGAPWATKLHFPVHCLSKVETYDRIRKTRFASEYTYHHGYYDHAEKEFRGFGRVDQKDSEDIAHFVLQSGGMNNAVEADLHQPPVLTKTWFHTGAYQRGQKLTERFESEYFQNPDFVEKALLQTILPDGATPEELGEALRACKGAMLRKEVYGLDGDPLKESLPYLVEQNSCNVQLLQPKGKNKHGVFLSAPSEAITYHYERIPAEPRINHELVVARDGWGNAVQQATVFYAKQPQIGNEPEQTKTHVVYTENGFTNEVKAPLDYRTPMRHFTKVYEITGLAEPADYFLLKNLKMAIDGAVTIDYDVLPTAGVQKRVLKYSRSQYCANDGTTALPFGTLQSKGLLHQSYKAAFNQNILTAAFGAKISPATLQSELTNASKGGYVFADNYFWSPSGTQDYDAAHFYLSTQFTDPFGNVTNLAYDAVYFLFVQKISDAVANERVIAGFNYRVLLPYLMKDANDNLTAVRFDEAGAVVKTFAIGKKEVDKGDEFDDTKVEAKDAVDFPSAEMEYGLNEWLIQSTATGFNYNQYKPRPAFVRTKTRTAHYHANPLHETNFEESYAYADGSGGVALTKKSAEPGAALQVNGDGTVTVIADTSPALRWVGSGRTILNNKGAPVKQYEPYFATTPAFDDERDAVHLGVTPVLHYDPIGRVVKKEFPDKTFGKTEFTPWKKATYDANDTVRESDWYAALGSPDPSVAQPANADARSAWLASHHHNTPDVLHLDSLGRIFLTFKDNGIEKISSKTVYDVEGNVLEQRDGLNRKVTECRYNMNGSKIHEFGMDAGNRWAITDAAGKPLFRWDDRNHQFSFAYDALQRPLNFFVTANGGVTLLYEKKVYGEGAPNDKANNLRGVVCKHYDQSGIVTNHQYEFKGKVLQSSRQFATEYKTAIDWTTIASVAQEPEVFENSVEYDALSRPVKLVVPHNTASSGDEIYPSYNVFGLMEKVDVKLKGVGGATPFVSNINYNAKGQRETIVYGNNTATHYTYQKETFRLKRLRTTRNAGAEALQDLQYTYDPVGNITTVKDDAQPAVIFDGEAAQALNDYTYDALYQLTKATGRKHAGQTDIAHNRPDLNYRNHPFIPSSVINPNDGQAFRNYREEYTYDKAGNLLEQKHVSSSSWTRAFAYASVNNQLTGTTLGAFTFGYTHDAHGNPQAMEHLSQMVWNFSDQLSEVDLGGGGKAYYTYDAGGQRTRKIIERPGGEKLERLYLGGFEVYRERTNAGAVALERETLHVIDGERRIAMVDTPVIKPAGNAETQTIRYQYSNHLESSQLELDEAAQIISYEEYFPFGTTSYSSTTSLREVVAKRYRYTGKERDEESGLAYHGARYYAPWLCRWTAADPIGTKDGLNVYAYVQNNPIKRLDKNGMQGDEDGGLHYRSRTSLGPLLRLDDSVYRWRFTQLPERLRGAEPGTPASGTLAGRFDLSADLRLNPAGVSLPVSLHADTRLQLGYEGAPATASASGLFTFGTIGSGVYAPTVFSVTGTLPLRPGTSVESLPGAVADSLPGATADLRFRGDVRAGSFQLGTYSGSAHLEDGRFQFNAGARSIAGAARLNVEGSGTLNPSGGADVQATARLRLFGGVAGVDATGSGTVSPTGDIHVAGSFTGYVLPVSYAFGRFDYNSRGGTTASATVLGATYTPSIEVRDPSPIPAVARESLHLRADPEVPSGLTVGASHTWFSQGAVGHVSGGWMPTASDPVRFGVHLTLPFSAF